MIKKKKRFMAFLLCVILSIQVFTFTTIYSLAETGKFTITIDLAFEVSTEVGGAGSGIKDVESGYAYICTAEEAENIDSSYDYALNRHIVVVEYDGTDEPIINNQTITFTGDKSKDVKITIKAPLELYVYNGDSEYKNSTEYENPHYSNYLGSKRNGVSTNSGISETYKHINFKNGTYELIISKDAHNPANAGEIGYDKEKNLSQDELDNLKVELMFGYNDTAKQQDDKQDGNSGLNEDEYWNQLEAQTAIPDGHNVVSGVYPKREYIKSTLGDTKIAIKDFTKIIKMFTNAYFAFGILSMALCFMLNIVNLVTSGSHPTQRHKAYENLMYCIICIGLLGSVKLISSLILQIVF